MNIRDRSSFLQRHKLMISGIVGVILLYVSAAGMVSISSPWENKTDTQFHIDYAWRVKNGELPKFKDGITYEPLIEEYSAGKVHLVASHPPLFYFVHSIFIGELLNNGEWTKAIAVGRLINVVFGVLVVISLAWAGWVFGGKRREIFAVAVPAAGALFFRFVSLNVNYTVDVLLVLFSTLAFVTMYKMLQNGLKPRYIVSLALLSMLGMSTKAPYIIILCVSILSIFLTVFIDGLEVTKAKLKKSFIATIAVLLSTILAIGWFYYLNYKQSGSWFKSTTDGFTGGRPYKSLLDILTGSKIWSLFYQNSSNSPFLSTAVTALAAGSIFNIKNSQLAKLKNNKPLLVIMGIMTLAIIGVFCTQLVLAVGHGSINFRYMLPVLLPFALFIAYGLLGYKRARGQLLSISTIILSGGVVFYASSSKTIEKLVDNIDSSSMLNNIYVAANSNGLPDVIPTLLLGFFLLGSFLLAFSLWNISKRIN